MRNMVFKKRRKPIYKLAALGDQESRLKSSIMMVNTFWKLRKINANSLMYAHVPGIRKVSAIPLINVSWF